MKTRLFVFSFLLSLIIFSTRVSGRRNLGGGGENKKYEKTSSRRILVQEYDEPSPTVSPTKSPTKSPTHSPTKNPTSPPKIIAFSPLLGNIGGDFGDRGVTSAKCHSENWSKYRFECSHEIAFVSYSTSDSIANFPTNYGVNLNSTIIGPNKLPLGTFYEVISGQDLQTRGWIGIGATTSSLSGMYWTGSTISGHFYGTSSVCTASDGHPWHEGAVSATSVGMAAFQYGNRGDFLLSVEGRNCDGSSTYEDEYSPVGVGPGTVGEYVCLCIP
jgi:hypothetical protein